MLDRFLNVGNIHTPLNEGFLVIVCIVEELTINHLSKVRLRAAVAQRKLTA